MTNEKLELMLDAGMAILRENDIKAGAMDKNFKPFNHLLSTEENEGRGLSLKPVIAPEGGGCSSCGGGCH